jgi:hypothetical protein
MRRKYWSVGLLFLVFDARGAVAQLIQPLLPVGDGVTHVQAMNGAGVPAGYQSTSDGNVPIVWRDAAGGYVPSLLPMISGASFGAVNGISSDGLLAGYLQPEDQETATAAVWKNMNPAGGYVVTALPAPSGFEINAAFSVNASGAAAGFVSDDTGHSEAVVWSLDTGSYSAALLPRTARETDGAATFITDSGDVAAYTLEGPPTYTKRFVNDPWRSTVTGAVWHPGAAGYTKQPLATIEPALPTSLSAGGFGTGVYAYDRPMVFALFEGDYYGTELPLPDSSTEGASNAINADDVIVGYAKDITTPLSGQEAAIWLPTDQFWDFLNQHLARADRSRIGRALDAAGSDRYQRSVAGGGQWFVRSGWRRSAWRG